MRNLPIYFMVLVFAGMLFALSKVHIYTPVVLPAEPEPAPVEQEGFTGRVIMPSLDDIYVLENTAGRDLVQFARFLKGRAAGLHYASAAYFKANQKNLKKDSPHAIMGTARAAYLQRRPKTENTGQMNALIKKAIQEDHQ